MKRSRAPNYTTAEIMHLLRLVEKFPIIKNKKTDGATVRDKQEAWQNLTTEYNSQTKFSPRTAANLLACYKNQKVKAKTFHSNEKMAIRGKNRNVAHSFQELANHKIDLVKAQRKLVNLQMQLQQLEIELAEEKLQFVKKKNEMELNFLKQKFEIELGLLRNKNYE